MLDKDKKKSNLKEEALKNQEDFTNKTEISTKNFEVNSPVRNY